MPSNDRRAAARRRAWGRGPVMLRLETLEGRRLLSASTKPDLVATQFSTVNTATWGQQITATGTIANRGKSVTTRSALVDIYASTGSNISATASTTELLGTVTVPAGLAPGAVYHFSQPVPLPPATPSASNSAFQTIYIALNVDPTNRAGESTMTDKNNRGIGIDTSVLVAWQPMPANLIGNALSVAPVAESTPGQISWGDTINVTEQIRNNGDGAAPATRARVVLTPVGATQGAYSDVTIGDIAVPALPAFGTANVVQQIKLPDLEPQTLGTNSQFTISVVQDGDFVTQPIYPHTATQGAGYDQGPISILPGPAATTTPQPVTVDLAPSNVQVSPSTLNWGQSFSVSAVVQNLSNVNAGPFTVRFVAAGATGDISHGIYLGDVTVPSLAANTPTTVVTTVKLPSVLPYGSNVASPAYSVVYAIADPEDTVDESLRSNNMASSAPVLLEVAGAGTTSTTVPTYPQTLAINPALAVQQAIQAANKQKAASLGSAKPASSTKTTTTTTTTTTNRLIKVAPKKHSVNLLAKISETVTGQIEGIPKGVTSLLKHIGITSSSNNNTAATTSNPVSTASGTTTTA